MKHFTMETARREDCPALEEMECSSFDYCWKKQDFEALIERGGLVLFSRNVGYIALEVLFGEAEILRLAVVPQQRRRGIATLLLHEAIEHMKEQGCENVFLEVSAANEAAALFYQRHEFSQTGLRKKYYRDGSDAILMHRKILDLSEKSSRKTNE